LIARITVNSINMTPSRLKLSNSEQIGFSANLQNAAAYYLPLRPFPTNLLANSIYLTAPTKIPIISQNHASLSRSSPLSSQIYPL
jgi:hypothetical protein